MTRTNWPARDAVPMLASGTLPLFHVLGISVLIAFFYASRLIWLDRSLLIKGAMALSCLLMTANRTPAHAQEMETFKVVAIEYPPLLGRQLDGYGTLFVLLNEYANAHFKVKIIPDFIPPARAQKVVYTGQWCLTTYPPQEGDQDTFFIPLRPEPIKLGLYRKHHPANRQPFKWDKLSELHGGSIAILRSNIKSQFHHDLTDAGLEIIYVETPEQAIQLLLNGRIDYAQGDNHALETLSNTDAGKLEFSQSYLFEAEVGFHYRISCAQQLFKEGHAPHILTAPTSDDLMQ